MRRLAIISIIIGTACAPVLENEEHDSDGNEQSSDTENGNETHNEAHRPVGGSEGGHDDTTGSTGDTGGEQSDDGESVLDDTEDPEDDNQDETGEDTGNETGDDPGDVESGTGEETGDEDGDETDDETGSDTGETGGETGSEPWGESGAQCSNDSECQDTLTCLHPGNAPEYRGVCAPECDARACPSDAPGPYGAYSLCVKDEIDGDGVSLFCAMEAHASHCPDPWDIHQPYHGHGIYLCIGKVE